VLDVGAQSREEGLLDHRNANKWPAFRIGVVLAVAALLVNAIVSYRGLLNLVRHNQLVVHTMQAISELDAVMSEMNEAESGQRRYLITDDPSYLQPYKKALTEIPRHAGQIATLTSDNSFQRSRMASLDHLIRQRLETLKQPIDLAQARKPQAARHLVATNVGLRQMEELRDLVADMRSHEEQLLAQRSQSSRRGVQQAGFAFSAAWLFAMVFLIAFFLTAQREVQERARDAHTIREQEAWLRTTLESIGDAVIATDAAERVTFINRVAEKTIGRASRDCIGKGLSEVFPIFNERSGEPAADPVQAVIERGATTGLANHTMLRNFRGESIPIEDSAAPIFDEEGRVSGVVLVFRDVSQQRKVQEMARTSEKLVMTGRLAATIAHEINNPLEAAINLLYLAQNSSSPREVQQYVANADHELSRMAHITRKTLAFHRSSSVETSTRIREMIEEVIRIYDRKIETRHISIDLHCPPDLVITTFRADLVQIASNLIANALDALEPGGNLVICATEEDQGARLAIEDNGSGIRPENLDHVFEPFFTTKKDTGTGLGLWVVKDLIEKLGGTIAVASRAEGPRHGTRFSIFIPSRVKSAIHTKAS
jgi:PAS domain S-box-containing protein